MLAELDSVRLRTVLFSMREKLYYVFGALLLLFSAVVIIYSLKTPGRMTNIAYDADNSTGAGANTGFDGAEAAQKEKNDKINEIYDINFIVSKTKTENMTSFVPKYESAFYDDAEFYAGVFGIAGETDIVEDGAAISFVGDACKLTISAEYNYLHYESYRIGESSGGMLSPVQSVNAAKKFLERRFLAVSYSEANVTPENGGYTVVFLSKLSGVKNYGFPVVVHLDLYGNVREIDYYSFEYDKLGVSKIKTMKEAAGELPTDGYEGCKIDLKSCDLVYYYEDSIIQPGYLFMGEIAGGGGFKCFIRAAKYE